MAIALVIIGLIVGGILVGQSLIKAAEVRAQLTQVEKFQSAVATFREKYGGLPGDLNQAAASQFGFIARGTQPGEGDGNGILTGYNPVYLGSTNYQQGELVTFWVDLSTAGLIDQTFTTGSETTASCQSAPIPSCFATAKIGNGNYVYVYSGNSGCCTTAVNYFSLAAVPSLAGNGHTLSNPGLTVAQAAAIDAKIDDGLPQLGNVTAQYSANYMVWAAGGGNVGASGGSWQDTPTTAATPGSTTTCYDNSTDPSGTPGINGAAQHYSMEMSNGSLVNCALSFKFQTGD